MRRFVIPVGWVDDEGGLVRPAAGPPSDAAPSGQSSEPETPDEPEHPEPLSAPEPKPNHPKKQGRI